MEHKNDCEISMEEFNRPVGASESEDLSDLVLEKLLDILGISVEVNGKNISMVFPSPDEYADRLDDIEELARVMTEVLND